MSISGSHGVLSRRRDGGWGWVVLVNVMLSQILLGGICLSGGVFYVIFRNAFNSTPVETSWLCSLPITLWMITSPIGSFLTNKYGFRTSAFIGGFLAATGLTIGYFATNIYFLFFSHGILTGLGFVINYTGCMSALNVYFDKYKTVATGVASIGHNAGLIIYAKFVAYLDDTFGWRGAFLVHGAMVFNLLVFATVMTPLEEDTASKSVLNKSAIANNKVNDNKHHTTIDRQFRSSDKRLKSGTLHLEERQRFIDIQISSSSLNSKKSSQNKNNNFDKDIIQELEHRNSKSSFDFSVLRKTSFICLCFSNILVNTGQGIYILHLPSYATYAGFTRDDFGTVLMVYGLTNIIGKVVYSFLGQHPKLDVTVLYGASLALTGVCIGLTPLFLTRSGMLTLGGLVGFFYCVTGALLPAVIFRIVGYERFPDGVGLSSPFKAAGNLIGGPVAGVLFSTTGNYSSSFYLAGVSMFISSLFIIHPIMHHRQNDLKQTNNDRYTVYEHRVIEVVVDEKV